MTTHETDRAEWTPVEPRQSSENDDRRALGEELDQIRANLGLSVRALAEKIEVDRETLRRLLAGDPSVRANKARSIETRIRALDAEMSSEREESQPESERIVELRLPGVNGDVVVSGPIGDLAALEESVLRLQRKHMENQSPPPD